MPSLFVLPNYPGSPPLPGSGAVSEGTGLGGIHYPPLSLLAPAEPGVMRGELGR